MGNGRIVERLVSFHGELISPFTGLDEEILLRFGGFLMSQVRKE